MPTLLVLLDGSARDEQVLPYVRLLAPLMAARVHLLRVVTDAEIGRLMAGEVLMEREVGGAGATVRGHNSLSQDTLLNYVEDYLTNHAAQLRAHGLEATVEVQVGSAEILILEIARIEQADLIILAPEASSDVNPQTAVSFISHIVQETSVPLLLVREAGITVLEGRQLLKHLLVPFDDSAAAKQALAFAIELATRAGAEITLLSCDRPAADGTLPPRQERIHKVNTLLNLAGEVSMQHQLKVGVARASGEPDQVIAQEALRSRADMIVTATRRQNRLLRWLFGNQSDAILHSAPVPVLAVPV